MFPPIAKPSDIVPFDEHMIHIQVARSLDTIIDNFDELKMNEIATNRYVICKLCCSDNTFVHAQSAGTLNQINGVISIPSDIQLDFSEDENLPKPFTNLKKTIKQHLSNKTHTVKLEAWKEKEEEIIKLERRNHQIGMRVARICYFLYRTGGSD